MFILFPKFQREVESPLGCSRSQQSREGDELLVTYKGFLADGTVFDSNEGKDPIRSDLIVSDLIGPGLKLFWG